MTKPLYETITPYDRWLITIVVMAATLMQVIDTTIVNVALPHMQGSLGASSDEITWTLTSYLVSSAIFMPLTGYLADTFGRKKYLIVSIAGFTFASILCGASTSITEIVIFRLLQGVFGAALVPMSQSIMADIFPPEDRGKAMAIWGIGVMVGPILGPTLGGYLTDIASWRWTFYVNVPVGIFTLLLINVIPTSPTHQRKMDWVGLLLISLAIGGLQYVLDRGNSDDWFSSTTITVMAYITISCFLGFIFHSLQPRDHHVFDISIFKDMNFVIASMLLCIFGLGLYGTMVILPLMMEGLLNYPIMTTGLILAPRGVSSMISMIFVSKLIKHVDPRNLVLAGLIIGIIGTIPCTYYSTNIDMRWLIIPLLIQGFGFGLIFVPLATIAFSTLSPALRTEAAGLYSLIRTIGSSIGISVTITVFTRRAQFFWNELGGAVNPYNPAVADYLHNLNLHANQPLSVILLTSELGKQSAMLAYVNTFQFIIWCFCFMVPIALLLKRGKKSAPNPMEEVMD